MIFFSHFSKKKNKTIICANGIAPDETSHLGLCCLPMSHKKTQGLYELKTTASDTICSVATGDPWEANENVYLCFEQK